MKNFNDFLRETHKGLRIVRKHLDEWHPQLMALPKREETRDRDVSLMTSYLRAHGWIISLSKLDQASDIQALACGCRSLLECAVDMILLASDATNASGEKMRWWDLSARYQMAIAFSQNKRLRNAEALPKEFVQRNKEFVKDLRTNLWPQWKEKNGQPRHPPRWTGNSDIREDIRKADSTGFGQVAKRNLNDTLLGYYGSEYQLLNRTIHGSGRVGIDGSAQIISIRAAHACWASASLGMISHQVLCIDRGLDKSLSDEWEHILKVRMTGFIYFIRQLQGEDVEW